MGDEVHFIRPEQIPISHERIFQHIQSSHGSNVEHILFWTLYIITALFNSIQITIKHNIERIVTFGPFYTSICALPVVFLRIQAITFIRDDNMLHKFK